MNQASGICPNRMNRFQTLLLHKPMFEQGENRMLKQLLLAAAALMILSGCRDFHLIKGR